MNAGTLNISLLILAALVELRVLQRLGVGEFGR